MQKCKCMLQSSLIASCIKVLEYFPLGHLLCDCGQGILFGGCELFISCFFSDFLGVYAWHIVIWCQVFGHHQLFLILQIENAFILGRNAGFSSVAWGLSHQWQCLPPVWVPVEVQGAILFTWLSADVPGKAAEGGFIAWTPAPTKETWMKFLAWPSLCQLSWVLHWLFFWNSLINSVVIAEANRL